MTLSTCGCCEPSAPATPLKIDNRPGLSAVAYRIGTCSSFRQAMLQTIAGTPELAALTTRLSDDHAITVLDLWATVSDILTFYQERIANEGFWRTARLRDSVLRIARLIDYQLGPGAAATALLAFTLEKNAKVKIPAGLRVQSVPGQDEKPQKFETLEAITADARLNRLRILPAPAPDPNVLAIGRSEAILRPASALESAAALAPGDRFVLFTAGPSGNLEEKEVVALRAEDDRIVLSWTPNIERSGWELGTTRAYKFTRTLRLFGCTAPSQSMRPEPDTTMPGGIKWTLTPTFYFYPQPPAASTSTLELDGQYDDLKPGMNLLVSVSGGPKTFVRITAVNRVQATLGPLSDSVTQVSVKPSVPKIDDRRLAVIYVLEGPRIRFWPFNYPETITTGPVYLSGRKIDPEAIEVGRTIVRNTFEPGVRISPREIQVDRRVLLVDGQGNTFGATLGSSSIDTVGGQDYLVLNLAPEGTLTLDAASAALLGNVARASHGETAKEEILGDGDAGATFQRLSLKKKPLTYVPSADPGGLRSSLKILVNRVLWTEVPSLYGQPPTAQVHVTRIADDGTVTVQFGDGVTGARTFSGRGNIMAFYRHGLGLAGRVRAGTVTTLLDRPLGLKSVTNPMPAEGGADPETLDEARESAPSTVRTFGRAVSLRDFEDLATASGEVAKAKATWVWSGESRVIHLTVAGQKAATFSPDTLAQIHASLTAQRDPNHTLLIDNFVRVPVVTTATLHVSEAYIASDVEKDARAALLEALSFEALPFGQPLHLSDIYRVLQEIAGVVWVRIDLFHFKDRSPAHLASRGADDRPVQEHLRIYPARVVPGPPGIVLPAEQAWIESPTQDITLLTSGGLPV